MIDIVNLRIKQYKDGLDRENNICMLPLVRIKTNVPFVTFISPECCQAIDAYLEFRSRGSAQRQHVTSDDNYLFIQERISSDYDPAKPETGNCGNLLRLPLQECTQGLRGKAQKINPNGWNLARNHQMRKFFNNTLRHAGMDIALTEHMLGHKPDTVNAAYLQINPYELKKRYIAFIPYITIERAVISENMIDTMRAEIKRLKGEAAANKVELYDHKELENMVWDYMTDFEVRACCMRGFGKILKFLLERKVKKMKKS